MKKTLITLLVLSGVAVAADSRSYKDYTTELKKDLVLAYSFDNTTDVPDYSATGITTTGSFTKADGIGTCSGSAPVKLTNLGTTEDFTFTFQLKDATDMLNNYKGAAFVTLYSTTSVSSTDGRENCFYINYNGKSNFGLADMGWGDATETSWTYDNKLSYNNAKGSVFTLTWDSSEKKGIFYKDGVSVVDFTSGAGNLQMITFASADSTHNTGTVKYDNIALWSRALSATEVKTLSTLPVPEPATATLSLLALAGLAMRRRRK